MGNNKIFIDNYDINSPFYNYDNKNIIIFSDVHYHKNVSPKLLELFYKYIITIKPDFIVIPGDLIDQPESIEDVNSKKFILNYLIKLSEIAKIIIIPGNHDIGEFTLDNFKNRLNNTDNYNNIVINFLNSLNNIPNIYFLNNEQVKIDGINFIGFNPRLETYLKLDEYTKEILIEDYLKNNFKFSEFEYNVFITHFNGLINNEDVYKYLSNLDKTDLLISGHYHNGYMPRLLDFYFKNNNYGLYITPKNRFFNQNITRGINEFGRGYEIVSRGFRKYATDINILNILDSLSSHDIECVNLANDDNLNYKRTLKKKV